MLKRRSENEDESIVYDLVPRECGAAWKRCQGDGDPICS